MKTLYIFLLLALSTALNGQYADYLISTKSGVAIGSSETGSGGAYGLDIQRHITLGIYGIVSYETGHISKGQYFNGNGVTTDRTYQATTMRQYNVLGLGLRKEMKLSPKGSVGVALQAQSVSQSRVDWDLFVDEDGVDLRQSQERYSKRSDLGIGLTLDYLHEINKFFNLGLYAGYQTKPEILTAGVRGTFRLGLDTENAKPNTSTSKNWMEFRIGSLGGDGVSPVSNYTLEYGRQLTNRFSVYGKYSVGKGFSDRNFSFDQYSGDDLIAFERAFLAADHEGENVILHPTQSTNLGGGIKFTFNTEGKSALSISGGASWYRADLVRFSSSGSKLEFYQETYSRYSEVLPEVGFHYDYSISDYFYIGGKIDFAFDRYNFGGGVHGGVRF